MTDINDRSERRDPTASAAAGLKAGLAVVLDAGDVIEVAGKQDRLPAHRSIPFEGGRLAGSHLLVPDGDQPFGTPAPPRYSISEGDGSGGTYSVTYGLDLIGDHLRYVVEDESVIEGDAAHSTAINPATGEAFANGAPLYRRVQLHQDAQLAAAAAARSDGNSVRPGLTWLPCQACDGHGRVVVVPATSALRVAGLALTVTAPCQSCDALGGMLAPVAAGE